MRDPEFLQDCHRMTAPRWRLVFPRTDGKQKAAIAAMTLTLVIIWARMMAGSGTPRSADASQTAPRNVSLAEQEAVERARIRTQLTAASQHLRSQLLQWARGSIPLMSCRLFSINLDFSQQTGGSTASGARTAGVGFWDQFQKSISFQADQKLQREQGRTEVFADAQRLRLQGTMLGPVPKALINGQLVKIGDTIRVDRQDDDGNLDVDQPDRFVEFKVVEISALSVVVERDEIRLLVSFK